MRNFFNLYINENVKLFRKKSTIVFMAIIFLSLLFAMVFVNLIEASQNNNGGSILGNASNSMTKDINEKLENALNDKNSNVSKQELNNLKAQAKYYNYATDNNISILRMGNSDWKIDVIESLIAMETDLMNLKDVASTPSATIVSMQLKIDDLFNILKNDEYGKYIDSKIAQYEESYKNNQISLENKDKLVYTEELNKKYSIGKNFDTADSWKYASRDSIIYAKYSLSKGIDEKTNVILSIEDKNKLNDNIILETFRLDNDIKPNNPNGSMNNPRDEFLNIAESIAMSLLGLFVIITAGGIISQEFSKGTIKLLVINPNKRWKIMLAKVLTLVVILAISTIALALLSNVVGSIFFGAYNASPYLYVADSHVNSINSFEYTILRFLTYDIDILIYMLFAMMISTITRNTSAAVGISIFIYIGNSIIMAIINSYISMEWVKFIPFNNMNLTNRIFENSVSLVQMNSGYYISSIVASITLSFSICVLVVCAILIVSTMFDSFNKKDIT